MSYVGTPSGSISETPLVPRCRLSRHLRVLDPILADEEESVADGGDWHPECLLVAYTGVEHEPCSCGLHMNTVRACPQTGTPAQHAVVRERWGFCQLVDPPACAMT
jgi:hypothetical protein